MSEEDLDHKEEISLKDRIYAQVVHKFPVLKPISRPETVGAVVIRPFPQKILNEGWSRYLPFITKKTDKPKLSLFGKHVPMKEMYSFARSLASQLEDKDLKQFEQDELLEDGEIRGEFDPYMYLTRLCLYDPAYYGTTPLPRWAIPSIPEFRPIKLSEVEINEPHANTGFPWLKPLFPRAQARDNRLYSEVVAAAARWGARIEAVKNPSADLFRSLTPPSAGFWRAQSSGRPVEGESKVIVLLEMQTAQPLQRALEAEQWYAYGDREARFNQMAPLVTEHRPGQGVTDGDDFCGVLADGRILSGDATAFDTSVRECDSIAWETAVSAHLSDSMARLYRATQMAADAVPIAANVGMVEVPYRHGVKSGTGSTHIKDSFVEYARWCSAKPWTSVSSVVERMSAVGGILKAKSQRLSKNWVFLAKLACNGQTLFGSIVRGVYGLCMYEDNPTSYMGPDDDDARVVSIVANTWSPNGSHPLWQQLVDWVKRYWDLRGDKKRVLALAADKLSKQRRFQRSHLTGNWERQAMDATWSALSGK